MEPLVWYDLPLRGPDPPLIGLSERVKDKIKLLLNAGTVFMWTDDAYQGRILGGWFPCWYAVLHCGVVALYFYWKLFLKAPDIKS